MQVLTRACGEDVSFIDVKIKIPEKGWPVDVNDVLHRKRTRGGFWGFWKSQLVELSSASGEDGWLSIARRSQASGFCDEWTRVGLGVGGRWKSQNRKNVYHSPYVEEPLNSKVIKSFVPELRSRKCFSCFEIPMFYVYMLWTSHVHFAYSCTWLWYRVDEKGDTLGIMQDIKICACSLHKPESVLENEIHENPLDFETPTDHPIPVRRPELVLINKNEKLLIVLINKNSGFWPSNGPLPSRLGAVEYTDCFSAEG